MKFIARYFVFILICSSLISCNNKVKDTEESTIDTSEESVNDPIPVKKEQPKEKLTNELEDQGNSVMLNIMVTPELKTFSSMLVTVGLAEMLLKKKGPFTLIGPSNEAFNGLSELQMQEILNTANKDELERLIKSYVIEEYLDSATLSEKIEEGNGSYEINSKSGTTYIATKDGETILITDENGVEARFVKSDIKSENGIVHVLDNVLLGAD